MRLLLVLSSAVLAAAPPPPVAQIKHLITADSLRGHVSFLASDLLAGRSTPSRGLEIAGEYIAAAFRAAGLEAAGDEGYYQNAELAVVRTTIDGFRMSVTHPGGAIDVPPADVALGSQVYRALELKDAPTIKITLGEHAKFTREQVEGRVVLTWLQSPDPAKTAERADWLRKVAAFREGLKPLGPAFVINVNAKARGRAPGLPAYVDPRRPDGAPSLSVNTAELAGLYEKLPSGPAPLRISVSIPAPASSKLHGRNVVAVLRGSDPVLKNTYVLLSAHYDHVGELKEGEDRIFNGANDNAGGVASLLQAAAALAKLQPRPRRSVVFIAYFGEERGMLGSRYYAAHPVFPLAATVANINLEHMGRTDDREGSQAGKATLTGFAYSDVGTILRKAAALTGYEIYDRKQNELYFGRSDNAPLAETGVPAHTLVVAYEYPDYHEPGDHWDKLDYGNMERVTEALAAGILSLANSAAAPSWNEAHPGAKPYANARKSGR